MTAEGITVRQLADLPHLRTEVVAGHRGLDRAISWAHVSEATNPWDWHEPGDLVITSGPIIPAGAAEQVAFVTRLADAGLSGLLAGVREPICPELTQPMLDAADELNFPVLVVRQPVPFDAHVRAVAAANDRGENAALRLIMRVHEEVRKSLIAQRSSAEFVAALTEVIGAECCCVVDAQWWEPALPGCPAPGPEWRPGFEREMAARGGLEPLALRWRVADWQALAMPIPVERPIFLVLSLRAPAPRLAVLQHVAAACALEITRVEAAAERQRRSGAALVSGVLAGRTAGSVIEAGLRERGLEPPYRCVAIDGTAKSVDRLAHRWTINGVPHLLTELGAFQLALAGVDDATLTDLAELADAEHWRVGVADPFSDSSGLPDAVRQARWALETLRPERSGLARYGDGGDSLLPRTVAESKLVTDRVLGRLLAYDEEHGTDLVKTLAVYLDTDRSPKRAAELLFVHAQTVTYRINRIQELTERSMHSTGDVSELWFALRALALSQAPYPGTSHFSAVPSMA